MIFVSKMKKMSLIICVAMVTLFVGSLITTSIPTGLAEDNVGQYKGTTTSLVMATAYQDAVSDVNQSDDADKTTTYDANVRSILTMGNFGNVGVLVGPYGKTAKVDNMSAFLSPASLDAGQISQLDRIGGNDQATKYRIFGTAIQQMNTRGKTIDPSSASIGNAMDGLSAAAYQFTNLGARLLKNYNPAPVILAFYDASKLNTNPDNKLVQFVLRTQDLKEAITMFGTPVTGLPNISLSFLILICIVVLYIGTSVVMTLINGRAAGENIRKAVAKFVVACIAVPLVAMALNLGIDFLYDFTDNGANLVDENMVENHLNFADWAATGFAVPTGVSLQINNKGEFAMTSADIAAINQMSYQAATGSAGTTAQISDRLQAMAREKKNRSSFAFVEATSKATWWSSAVETWSTEGLFMAADALGKNDKENKVTDIKKAEGGTSLWDSINQKYLSSTYQSNQMTINGDTAIVTGLGAGNNSTPKYGVSAIAATNILRTEFTSTKITASSGSGEKMATIVHYADGFAPTGEAPTRMDPIVRFLATFSMVMAAVTGLFTLLGSGFSGLVSGGLRSAFGSSQGFGQMIGGVIALLGGVFGIGFIMVLTYELLDQVYGMLIELFGGNAPVIEGVLAPIRELLEKIPILGAHLASLLESVVGFIVTVMAVIALPKFGGIPIKLFCQKLSDLPGVFAEKAQQVENKFTGDFRSGGGGGRGGGSAANAMQGAFAGAKAQQQALAAGAGAVGGFALSKIGAGISNKFGDNNEGNSTDDKDVDASSSNAETTQSDNDTATANAENMDGTQNSSEDGTQGADGKSSNDSNSNSSEDGNADTDTADSADTVGSAETLGGSDNVSAPDSNSSVTESYSEGDNSEGDSSLSEDSSLQEGSDTESSVESESLAEVDTQIDTESHDSASSEQNSMSDNSSDVKNVAERTSVSQNHSSSTNTEGKKNPVASGKQNSTPNATSSSSMSGGSKGKSAPSSKNTVSGAKSNGTKTMGAKNSTNVSVGGNAGKSPKSISGSTGKSNNAKRANSNTARVMRAIGKGMQAAGGNTTGSQAIAGALHMAGAVAGLEKHTGNALNAANKNAQRQKDIAAGLGPSYSEDQDKQKQPDQNQSQNNNDNTRDNTRFMNEANEYQQNLDDEQARRDAARNRGRDDR